MTVSTEGLCFAVEDLDGDSYELEILPSDDRARLHLQSIWQRLASSLEFYHKAEHPPVPEWVAWKPWKWCSDKREAYQPRTQYVAWCGSQLAGILNVWPGFASRHQPGALTLYVEHLGASPGNLKTAVWHRRYTKVGQALLAYAVKLSVEAGFDGRISLHASSDEALGFCRRVNQKLHGELFYPEERGVQGPTPHGSGDTGNVFLESQQAGALMLLEVYRA